MSVQSCDTLNWRSPALQAAMLATSSPSPRRTVRAIGCCSSSEASASGRTMVSETHSPAKAGAANVSTMPRAAEARRVFIVLLLEPLAISRIGDCTRAYVRTVSTRTHVPSRLVSCLNLNEQELFTSSATQSLRDCKAKLTRRFILEQNYIIFVPSVNCQNVP